MTNRFTGAMMFARNMASQPAAWFSTKSISARGVLGNAHHKISTTRVSARGLLVASQRNLSTLGASAKAVSGRELVVATQRGLRTLGAKRISARGVVTTAQHTLTVFGVSALVVLAVLFARPDLAKQLGKSLNHEADAEVVAVTAPPLTELMETPASAPVASAAPLTAEEKALLGTQKQQQWVTSWLSKRYRVAGDAANMLVSTAYLTAREIKLDPLLILAVMAIESGLNPFAESPVGAQGLMQVMSKIHHEKFQDMGGVQAALNPVANIRVGSLILKDYVTRGGSVEAGLKTYVGAAAFEHDDGYGSRVLAEYRRLKQVSAGKKVPTITPMMAAAPKDKDTNVASTEKIAKTGTQIAGL